MADQCAEYDEDDWDDFDDSNRDNDPDDPNDSIWDDNYEGESYRLGCCMPDRCLMPGEHMVSECFDAEMAEVQMAEMVGVHQAELAEQQRNASQNAEVQNGMSSSS